MFVCLLRQPPAAAMLPIAADIARRTELRSGYMHKKLVKIVIEFPEISSRTDRQTQTDIHTDVLITILRNRFRFRG